MAQRTNDAPTRESLSRVRTPPARRPPPVDRASCCTHTHPSVVKERGSRPNADRPTRHDPRRWGDRSSPWEIGMDRYSRSRACSSRLRAVCPSVLRIPTSPCVRSLQPVIRPAKPAGDRFPDDGVPLPVRGATSRWPARRAHSTPQPSGKNPAQGSEADGAQVYIGQRASKHETIALQSEQGPNDHKCKKSRLRGCEQRALGSDCLGRAAPGLMAGATAVRQPTGRDSR
jgi:hypothetical protein